MAYVYKHIRLDKNEVFYIGIGLKDTNNFKRAYEKSGRNDFWKKVIKLTKYKVEIIHENLSWDEACRKEIEYIKLHGRRNCSTGTLVNLTDGGEGSNGYIVSDEVKLRLQKINNCKKVLQFDMNMNLVNSYLSLKETSRITKFSLGNLSKACNGVLNYAYGFIWRFESSKYIENTSKKSIKQKRRVAQMDSEGNVIKIYDSVSQASTECNIPRTSISNCCFANLNELKYSAYDSKWKFIDKINYI